MAFTIQSIPAGTPYFDPATGAVQQQVERWRIVQDTATKIFAANPDLTINKASWQDATLPTGYYPIGFGQAVAVLIAVALNNAP